MGGQPGVVSDAELVIRSQRGDVEAFNSLATRSADGLYRFIRKVLGHEEEARDICQEALAKAYENIGRLRDPSKFRAWLHHIALNLCRDWHRSSRRRMELRAYDETGPQEARVAAELAADDAPDRHLEHGDLSRILREILEELPLEQRTAIVLREFQGFTSREIAEIAGVPAATIRTRIYYGLRAARRMLLGRGITESAL